MAKPLLLLELNELSPDLLDRYIAAGAAPELRRGCGSRCETYVTDAGEEERAAEPLGANG